MDIQELVDLRIAEIQSRTAGSFKPDQRVDIDSNKYPGPTDERNLTRNRRFAHEPDMPYEKLQVEAQGFGNNMGEVLAAIDDSLARIAEKMLDVTDMVAGDYGRLENDLLKSRLAVLLGAESVLDMAVTLREKALLINSEYSQSSRLRAIDEEYATQRSDKGRASMHSNGVAALFRKT